MKISYLAPQGASTKFRELGAGIFRAGIGALLLLATAASASGPAPATTTTEAATLSVVAVPAGAQLSAAVYDAAGRQVRVLHRLTPAPASGPVTLSWDGRDDFGAPAPVGTYTWKALVNTVQVRALPSVGNTGTPPYGDSNASKWVTGVAFDAAGNWYQTASWDESGKALRSFDAAGNPRWSYGHNGLYAVATDGQYVYAVASNLGGKESQQWVRRQRCSDGHPEMWADMPEGLVINAAAPIPPIAAGLRHRTNEQQRQVVGVSALAVDAAHLYVSNWRENRIDWYDKRTGAAAGSLPFPGPRGLAVDPRGGLWVADGVASVVRLDLTGAVLQRITGLNEPDALGLVGPAQDLLVAERGPSQVLCFARETEQLRWARGGRAAPGPVRDDRYRWDFLCAVGGGVDGRYGVTDNGNQRLLFYQPDGALWRQYKADFAQPGPFADPSVDPRLLLSGRFQYDVNLDTGAWTFTHNWLLPDLRFMDGNAFCRKLSNGRRYLFYLNPSNWGLGAYALGDDGTSIRRSTMLGTLWTGADDNTDHQWKPRPFRWIDRNGDGQVEDSETNFEASAADLNYFVWRGWITERGDWYYHNVTLKQIEKLALLGFDAHGNPQYDWQQRQVVLPPEKLPAGWEGLLRVLPGSSEMLLGGYPAWTQPQRKPGGLYHQGGWAIAHVNAGGEMVSQFLTEQEFVAFATDGQFVYAGHNPRGQEVHVYTLDGLLVAKLIPGAAYGHTLGWMDTASPLTAFIRPDQPTEHHLYTEDVLYSCLLHWVLAAPEGTLRRTEGVVER